MRKACIDCRFRKCEKLWHEYGCVFSDEEPCGAMTELDEIRDRLKQSTESLTEIKYVVEE